MKLRKWGKVGDYEFTQEIPISTIVTNYRERSIMKDTCSSGHFIFKNENDLSFR